MKKQRKTRVAVTRELYSSVKGYKNATDYTQRDVAAIWDVSQGTVNNIYRSKNFKQYKLRFSKNLNVFPDFNPVEVMIEKLDKRTDLSSESSKRLKVIERINVLLNKLV